MAPELLKVEGGETGVVRTVDVEIVVPVFDEEADLEASIRRLHSYLKGSDRFSWLITIADNASRDQTWGIACRLAGELDGVRAVHLAEKGRGRALRAVWSGSDAAVVAYMDVDLSTDLDALLPLVAPLLSRHSDLAIGTRLAPGARVVRGPKREVISRGYNLILKATLRNGFSDAQCGFKAVRADVARALLPLVEDNGWFFDTELLVLAEHNGLRIHEVPVDWIDDPDSRVHVASTAIEDLKGIWRMLGRFAKGGGLIDPTVLPRGARVMRFAGVGAATTALFTMLFVILAGALGPISADAIALVVCGVVNVAGNQRARRSHTGRRRHFAAGLALSALPLVATVAALVALGAVGVTSIAVDLLALTVVNAAVTVARWGVQSCPKHR